MSDISIKKMQECIQDMRTFGHDEVMCEGYQRSIVLACAQILESILENREID